MTQPPYPDEPSGPRDEVGPPPPLPGPAPRGFGGLGRPSVPEEIVPAPALPPYQPGPAPNVPARPQQEQTLIGGFGDLVRTGVWTPARKTTSWQLFGDLKLDLRQVLQPGEVLEVESWSIFGDVRILVPLGTEVLVNGGTMLGDVKTESDPREQVAPTGARLVLNVYGMFGDVRVREAGPDVGKPPRGWRWAKPKGIT